MLASLCVCGVCVCVCRCVGCVGFRRTRVSRAPFSDFFCRFLCTYTLFSCAGVGVGAGAGCGPVACLLLSPLGAVLPCCRSCIHASLPFPNVVRPLLAHGLPCITVCCTDARRRTHCSVRLGVCHAPLMPLDGFLCALPSTDVDALPLASSAHVPTHPPTHTHTSM